MGTTKNYLDKTGTLYELVKIKEYVGDNYVAKETGKGLSTNDYTTAEKQKLQGIEAEANKTIVDSELSSTSTNPPETKLLYSELQKKQDLLKAGEHITIAADGTISVSDAVDIDDTITATTKTWSSKKVSDELATKQGTLTPGDNVTIDSNNVINVTGSTSEITSLSEEVSELASEMVSLSTAQSEINSSQTSNINSLTSIDNSQTSELVSLSTSMSEIASTVSAQSTSQASIDSTQNSQLGSLATASSELSSETEVIASELATKQDELTAGARISISGTTISATTEIDDLSTTTSNTWSADKINAVINALNHLSLAVVSTLPTQNISTTTIYLVPKSAAQSDNIFDEYIYVSTHEFVNITADVVIAATPEQFPLTGEDGKYYIADSNPYFAYVWIESRGSYVEQNVIETVSYLPSTGEDNKIYAISDGSNKTFYMWENVTGWEKIGDTSVDLSGYVLESDLVPISNSEIDAMFE